MTHAGFESQLDALLDGELTDADARELEAHIAQCPECARFRDERLELRAAIAVGAPTFQAPDALRDRLRSALKDVNEANGAETRSRSRPASRTGRASSYLKPLLHWWPPPNAQARSSKRAIKSRDRLIDDSLSFISCNRRRCSCLAISISAAERLN